MLVIDPESFRQQQSPRGIEDADPYNEKSLPLWGRWPSEARSDEGQPCLHNPCMGHCGKVTPHPAFGHLPPVGEGFFYFHILIIPNAFATELARMTAAKIGQSQRIMKRNTFLRRKG